MWYLAEILFAEPRQTGRRAYQCESCNVVFDSASSVDAYRKAVAWGQKHAAEPPAGMQFLGVSHLTTIGDQLGDGIEICGRFFESADVWDRVEELVPLPESLKAVIWEQNQDKPLRALLNSEQITQLKHRLRALEKPEL